MNIVQYLLSIIRILDHDTIRLHFKEIGTGLYVFVLS